MNAKIHVLSRAVIIDQGHILLAYDPRVIPMHYYEFNKKFYYLPGGHVEFQESAEKAVLREIKEETGYYGVIESFLGTMEHAWSFPGSEICCHTHEINLIFKVNIAGLSVESMIDQREDHVGFQWTKLRDLEAVDLRPMSLKKMIGGWLKASRSPYLFTSTMV